VRLRLRFPSRAGTVVVVVTVAVLYGIGVNTTQVSIQTSVHGTLLTLCQQLTSSMNLPLEHCGKVAANSYLGDRPLVPESALDY